jgi:dUTP pyrophosphatase
MVYFLREVTMKVKIKKLHPDAVIPKYATPGSAGFDLVAIEDVTIWPNTSELVKTGLSVEIPDGFEMQVIPRSGLSLKTSLRIANSPGCIDSDYRGEVCVIAWNSLVGSSIFIKKGDRIAQGKIAPIVQAEFEEVEELSDTKRGSGGFGSTGK